VHTPVAVTEVQVLCDDSQVSAVLNDDTAYEYVAEPDTVVSA
jgi:hypothetical protein